MAFRKRNVAIGRQLSPSHSQGNSDDHTAPTSAPSGSPGVRPSPLTSHPTTSTGTASIDALLGGHGGLALGSSMLIEESGTTDFAGALLRYYAAEGVCHGHVLHVVGVGEGWARELPGVSEKRDDKDDTAKKESAVVDRAAEERMKIAWRYERSGKERERALPDRSVPTHDNSSTQSSDSQPFCHTFDLTKRLTIPAAVQIEHIPFPTGSHQAPFDSILNHLTRAMTTSSPQTIHRLVIPTLLSPAIYPPHASMPTNVLRFLHGLRALLRRNASRLTAMISLPLDLYPRASGLVRWAEILSDCVMELTPFPHLMDASIATASDSGSGGGKPSDEQPQGMFKVHKLPIVTERGEGGAGAGGGNSIGEDLAFTVSRRKFVVKPYSLPPVGGDTEAQQQQQGGEAAVKAKDVEF